MGEKMELFMAVYDIKEGHPYTDLYSALGKLGAAKVEQSVVAFRSDKTVAQLRDELWRYMQPGDRLVVMKVANWASMNAKVSLNDV